MVGWASWGGSVWTEIAGLKVDLQEPAIGTAVPKEVRLQAEAVEVGHRDQGPCQLLANQGPLHLKD